MADVKNRKSREDDPRYRRSLSAILDAVTSLIEAHSLAEISITRVVEAAGVTRPTFYQHFADVPAAARVAGLARLEAAFPPPEPLSDLGTLTPQALRTHIVGHVEPVLRHLCEHRVFYLRILDGAGNVAFFEEIVSFVSGRMLPDVFEIAAREGGAETDDLIAVTAGGVMWLTIRWLRGEPAPENAAQMAHRIAGLTPAMVARIG